MIKWISFQSLIGGETIGAENAFGSPPIMCIDYEGVANSELYVNWLKSRGLNIPHIILEGGILSRSETVKPEFQATFDKLNKNIDVVCAVPICSGLSHANASKGHPSSRGSSAIQNNNMLGIAEFTLNYIQPAVYLFENAPALYSKTSELIRNQLNDIAQEHGYSVSYIKTNTMFYGLPQKRERTFCIMWKGNKVGVLDIPKIKYRTIEDVIKNCEGLNGSNIIPFDENTFANNPYIKYCYAKYGKDDYRYAFSENPRDILRKIFKNNDVEVAKQINKDNEKFCNYLDYAKSKFDIGMNVMDASPLVFHYDKPCCTIFGRLQNRIVHPTKERGLSLREMMRLMGMPDDFPIELKNAAMIGQNVPVNTAQYQCEQIVKFLNGKLKTKKAEVNFQVLKPDQKIKKSKYVQGVLF